MQDIPQWEFCSYDDVVAVEIMLQFSRGDQYGVDQLLNLGIPSLGLIKYFTYEVD